tara:strand:+ start:130 stop:315 length:186 start_codon:yes stop_codon:yes gene_type:complete
MAAMIILTTIAMSAYSIAVAREQQSIDHFVFCRSSQLEEFVCLLSNILKFTRRQRQSPRMD